MNKDKQRIAIAEFCGWNYWFNGWNKLDSNNPPLILTQDLPNYPEDLNAMHEVEKLLTDEQLEIYRIWISDLQAPAIKTGKTIDVMMFHATASQRAEALLRTIEKWEEE